MQTKLTQGTLELAAGKAYSLHGRCGYLLSCSKGRVWLTLTGHAQDVVMQPGQTLVLPDDGLVVVESDTGAVLSFGRQALREDVPAVRRARAAGHPGRAAKVKMLEAFHSGRAVLPRQGGNALR